MALAQHKLPNQPASSWADILFLILFLGSLFFILLGTRPLFTPDEGRYAEIAREMVLTGNYITPYLNSVKYFEKPILYYWLGAFSIKTLGLNIWSIRSINALLGLLGCLLTYATARKLYGRNTGLLAALILGTNILYFIMAHTISLDLPITVFSAASLYAFLLGAETTCVSKRQLFFWSASIAAALAVLTKGLIGIVFPIMIIGTWIALFNEWKLLKPTLLLSCFFIFLIIATPWHLMVGLRNPEFFYFYFIEQHVLRYTTMDVGHYQPVWFFIPCLLLGFFPWIFFLPQTIFAALPQSWKTRQIKKSELFFLLWVVLVFVFFSFSKSKLIPYILPIFPPLSILTARYLTTSTQKFSRSVLLSAVMWLFLLIVLACLPSLDTRTIRPLAETLKPILKSEDDVITFNRYYQDLPFYLERRISILNWKNELSYGMQHQDTHDWMINDQVFWQRWHSNRRIYVVIGEDEYASLRQRHPKERIYLLNKTSQNVLISNQNPTLLPQIK